MKRIFLGITLLLSTQVIGVSANQEIESKKLGIEKVNVLNVIRSKDGSHILPSVGETIVSKSSTAMFADGSIVSVQSSSLTVLNKTHGLARISILTPPYGPHEFLLGRVGDEYFGTSIDREGSIFLKRVSEGTLEVTFTRVIDATGLPLQVRAKFRR